MLLTTPFLSVRRQVFPHLRKVIVSLVKTWAKATFRVAWACRNDENDNIFIGGSCWKWAVLVRNLRRCSSKPDFVESSMREETFIFQSAYDYASDQDCECWKESDKARKEENKQGLKAGPQEDPGWQSQIITEKKQVVW